MHRTFVNFLENWAILTGVTAGLIGGSLGITFVFKFTYDFVKKHFSNWVAEIITASLVLLLFLAFLAMVLTYSK